MALQMAIYPENNPTCHEKEGFQIGTSVNCLFWLSLRLAHSDFSIHQQRAYLPHSESPPHPHQDHIVLISVSICDPYPCDRPRTFISQCLAERESLSAGKVERVMLRGRLKSLTAQRLVYRLVGSSLVNSWYTGNHVVERIRAMRAMSYSMKLPSLPRRVNSALVAARWRQFHLVHFKPRPRRLRSLPTVFS